MGAFLVSGQTGKQNHWFTAGRFCLPPELSLTDAGVFRLDQRSDCLVMPLGSLVTGWIEEEAVALVLSDASTPAPAPAPVGSWKSSLSVTVIGLDEVARLAAELGGAWEPILEYPDYEDIWRIPSEFWGPMSWDQMPRGFIPVWNVSLSITLSPLARSLISNAEADPRSRVGQPCTPCL